MKNKKKFFDKSLYFEGLRQLKVIGILGMAISLIFAIGIPVGGYLSAKAEYRASLNGNLLEQFTKHTINAVESHIYYLLFFLIFAPLMVIILFKFLNRRENCDFYHSLPHTRHCLFLSFFTAVLTWITAQIFFTTVISALLYKMFSGYMILEYSRLFCFAVNVLIASFLVASALLLACTLSGNTITSLIVFLILFFTPRIFTAIYQALMSSELDYLTNSINSVFGMRNNLFYNILESLNSATDTLMYKQITSIRFPAVYTFFLTVVLSVLAYIFFARRKSEAAEDSMNNKALQTIFRTIFTMLLCMIPISILFSYYVLRNTTLYENYYESISMIVFSAVISYIAVILGMFLYELLTTKNPKSALRSLKSLPAIAVLNIVVFILLAISFGHYKNLRLNEDEIESVNLVSLGHFYENNYYYNQSNYFEAMISKYDFTQKELVSLLCSAFNDYADMYSDYLDGKREHIYYNNNNDSYEMFSMAVQFHGKSDNIFHLQLDTKTKEEFFKLLYSNKEFYDIYMGLPELTDKDTIYFSDTNNSSGIGEEFTKELYESLRNELAESEIPPKEWIESIDTYGVGYIVINKYIDSAYYDLRLPINLTTPDTYEKLLNYYKETHSDDLEDFLNSLDTFENILSDTFNGKDEMRAYYDITGYDSVNVDSSFVSFSTLTENQNEYESEHSYLKKAVSLLREHTKSISDMVQGEDMMIYVGSEQINYYTTDAWRNYYILAVPIDILKELAEEFEG